VEAPEIWGLKENSVRAAGQVTEITKENFEKMAWKE
jgi:hypothetical protein